MTATPAAVRQRRYLARQRRGRIVLPVEVDEHDLVAALAHYGFMPKDAADRDALARAVADLLDFWLTVEKNRDASIAEAIAK